MAFEFAQVVSQLVDAVASVGELEGADYGLMDLLGGPATNVAATVQEDFEQAHDARIMELDAGIADCADGDGEGETLQTTSPIPISGRDWIISMPCARRGR
jgi:hypothetical protein